MGTIFIYPNGVLTPMLVSIDATIGTSGSAISSKLTALLHTTTGNKSHFVVEGKPLSDCRWGDKIFKPGCVVREMTEPPRQSPAASLQLRALSGPDSCRCYDLARGEYRLGKSAQDAELFFADDGLGRVHGRLLLNRSGILWQGATNSRQLELGKEFSLGNSTFVIERIQLSGEVPTVTFDDEEIEVELAPARKSWMYLLMIVMPLAIGLVIARITGMWLFLLMSLASSLLMGAHWVASKGESKKSTRALAQGAEKDRARTLALPGICQLAMGYSIDSGDRLALYCGRGSRAARLSHRNIADYRVPRVQDIPLYIATEPGTAFISRSPLPVLRSQFLSLLALQKPLVCVQEKLPAEVHSLTRVASALPWVQTVAHTAELENVPKASIIFGSTDLLAHCKEKLELDDSFLFLWEAEGSRTKAKADVELETTGVYRNRLELLRAPDDLAPETWDCWADGLAEDSFVAAVGRRLPGASATVPGDMASGTRMLPQFSLPSRTRYRRQRYSHDLLAYIGIGTQGDITAGLVSEGPHWLLAGTTGSGKSQLLITLLMSLALNYPPERLAFSLIDFKGGATLGAFAALPHTANVLTDLDEQAVDRALRYLRADLHAREKEFQRLSVTSYTEYLELHRVSQSTPDFPELVIAVDEFKMLVDRLPQAMNELMKIATIGRSLGVHLILATQRPQGAVSQDIRANIALSLCLRVASAQDSHNVLGHDDAAAIPTDSPGRGYLAIAGEPPLAFQAPLFDGIYASQTEPSAHLLGKPQKHGAATETSLQELSASMPAPTSYCPIPPDLPQYLAAQVSFGDGFHLGRAEYADRALVTELEWRPAQHGSLCILAEAQQREILFESLLLQARYKGRGIVLLTADGINYRRGLQDLANGGLSAVLGLEDIDFVRSIISDFLEETADGQPLLLVLDALDLWMDSLIKNPELESRFQLLLREANRYGHAVLATASQPLRGKTAHSLGSLLWSETVAGNDPLKKSSKSFPKLGAYHYAVEGQIAQEVTGRAHDIPSLAPSCASQKHSLPPLAPLFAQLPLELSLDQMAAKPAERMGRFLLLGQGRSESAYLPLARGKFIPLVGRRGSGKTQLLRIIHRLNPEFSTLYLSAGAVANQSALEKVLQQVELPERTLLLVDDLNEVPVAVQEEIIRRAADFASVLVAFRPWMRWRTSPILQNLQGCSRGVTLSANLRDLELFADPYLPSDLKTRGQIPVGRALLFTEKGALAFQVPLQSGQERVS